MIFILHSILSQSNTNFKYIFATGNMTMKSLKKITFNVLAPVLHYVHQLVVKLDQICFNDQ